MRKVQWIGAAVVMVPFAAIAADTVQMTEGRWEEVMTVTSASLGGKAISPDTVPDNTKTKFTCISANQSRDPAQYFLKPDKKNACQPSGTVANGRIAMGGTCNNEKIGSTVIEANGTYQPNSYEIDARATLEIKQMPLILNFTSKGRYVGKCDGTETVL